MVKNRETHAAPPSSEETDSETSSSEVEGSPSTPPPPRASDKKPAALKKPSAEPSAVKKAAKPDSDSDDSDSPVKPVASKPINDGSKLKKPRSKPNHKPSSPTPFPSKRAPSTEDKKDSKKPKTEKGAEEEGKKSTMFQRLWSDDDEIVILKGMLEYKEKKGPNPMADTNDFHEFIKNSLHINFDRRQMVSKVRRLKERYKNSVGKKKTYNAHEKIVLDLSEKIWGNDVKNPKIDKKEKISVKSPSKMSTVATNGALASSSGGIPGTVREEGDSSWKFIGKASISMGLDENTVKLGLGWCKEDKKAEIEEKWKQLHLEEASIFSRKLDLACEENKMIIEALKSGRK